MNGKTLEAIFGSVEKGKIIRVFVFNSEKTFTVEAIASRVGTSKTRVTKEIKILLKAGLIVRKTRGFALDKTCSYLGSLAEFLSATNPAGEDIADRMAKAGKIKLLVLAGAFIDNPESRLDILVAGDKIKKPALDKVLRSLESDMGKELSFSVFDTDNFKYRFAMHDKLIMDVFDFPHEKIVNKLGI